ncbi:DUF4427 domain-containing protein [Salmonella enterica subsp. enterica]|nr:DUF4427 domain-containing protein [Salmonella enterica subsp. enterica]
MITNPVWYGRYCRLEMITVNKEGRYLLDVNLASADWPLRRRKRSFRKSYCGMHKTSF